MYVYVCIHVIHKSINKLQELAESGVLDLNKSCRINSTHCPRAARRPPFILSSLKGTNHIKTAVDNQAIHPTYIVRPTMGAPRSSETCNGVERGRTISNRKLTSASNLGLLKCVTWMIMGLDKESKDKLITHGLDDGTSALNRVTRLQKIGRRS